MRPHAPPQVYPLLRRRAADPRPANIDDGPSKDLILPNGLAERPIPEGRLRDLLYDLLYGSNEASNLAGDPAYADVLEEMRERLRTWKEKTDAPLLRGPVPAPVGAEINLRDQLRD